MYTLIAHAQEPMKLLHLYELLYKVLFYTYKSLKSLLQCDHFIKNATQCPYITLFIVSEYKVKFNMKAERINQ